MTTAPTLLEIDYLYGLSKQALVTPLETISKNGYLYVYVSNESSQGVYVDDITTTHHTGPLCKNNITSIMHDGETVGERVQYRLE